jgi:hypothetical protein
MSYGTTLNSIMDRKYPVPEVTVSPMRSVSPDFNQIGVSEEIVFPIAATEKLLTKTLDDPFVADTISTFHTFPEGTVKVVEPKVKVPTLLVMDPPFKLPTYVNT